MKTTIAPYEADARTVTVTFEQDGIIHTRTVNACFDDAGTYDDAATAERVEDVARGVANKIQLGILKNAETTTDTTTTTSTTASTPKTSAA